MAIKFFQRLFIFLPTLFCFCLPFGTTLLSLIIAIWFIVSFFNSGSRNIMEGLKNNAFRWSLLFFILTCISAGLSSNGVEALSAIEVKLSFVFLPYLLFCFRWPQDLIKRWVVSFVSGCFFACVLLIGRATIYAVNGQPEYFFYSSFSNFIHASYFAMYLLLAITFVIVLYGNWFKTQKNIIYSSYFFVLVFIVTIFLCSSKLGIISLFICLPATIIYKFKLKFSFKTSAYSVLLLVLALFIMSRVFPTPFERMNSILTLNSHQLDKTSSESTAVRVLIWEQALSIIKQNLWIGVGVGDANEILYEAYLSNGLTGAYEHRLNAHSQYLQTGIGMGLAGFLALFMLTFWQLIRSIMKREFIATIFSLLIVLNFFVESMLQTAAGVLFFAFFYCFFNLVNHKQLSGE